MDKKHGYYIATVPGGSNSDVIVYWDGESFLTVGNDCKLNPDEFLFIADKPIDTNKSTVEFCSGEHWNLRG